MRTGYITALLCLILLIILPHAANANTRDWGSASEQGQSLTALSDRIFQYTNANQREAAASLLAEFNKKWKTEENNYPQQDQAIIQTASDQMKLMLRSNVNNNQASDAAITLRLSVDALTPAEAPLWKELQPQVMQPISKMKKAIASNQQDVYQTELNHFLDSYSLVYPSMVIDGRTDMIQAVDQKVSQLDAERSLPVNKKSRIRQLNVLDSEMKQAFEQGRIQNSHNFVLMAVSLAGFVLLILGYSSWRRYKGSL
ncbi:MAG: sporulation protein YpjB [Sporolactobacillus sp.]